MKILNYSKQLIKTRTRLYSINNNVLKPPWDVLFFGTDKFSLTSLKVLHEEKKRSNTIIRNLEVVTTLKNSYVNKYALENALPVQHWPLKVEEFKCNFHIGLVVSFGQLIPKNLIEVFPMGMINVHASLLPRWRGAAPIIHALAAGDDTTGVTIMKIRPHKFDIGEIIYQETVPIASDMRMPELYELLASRGASNLLDVLRQSPAILEHALPQDASTITSAPRVNPSMANIDFSLHTARQLYNLSRALAGLYPLVAMCNGKVIKVHNVVGFEEGTCQRLIGSVEYVKRTKLLKVTVRDGWILVDKIGVVGKKIMNATEFNNGYLKNSKELVLKSPTS